jgi:hypothetical protein
MPRRRSAELAIAKVDYASAYDRVRSHPQPSLRPFRLRIIGGRAIRDFPFLLSRGLVIAWVVFLATVAGLVFSIVGASVGCGYDSAITPDDTRHVD